MLIYDGFATIRQMSSKLIENPPTITISVSNVFLFVHVAHSFDNMFYFFKIPIFPQSGKKQFG